MIRITVHSFNGTPVSPPLSAQFDELGGDIGRAEGNLLVLPDPERTISRVHAKVVFRANGYALIDQGSNPVSINDQPLGNGREAAIRPGDRLQIGGYVLMVEAGQAGGGSAAADPFADFLGLAAPAAAPRAAGPANAASLDPLAAFGMAPSPAPAPSAWPAPSPAPSSSAGGMGGIPDDWDPFAITPAAKPTGPAAPPPSAGARSLGLELGAAAPASLIPDLPLGASGGGGGNSLDQLFGLGGSGGGNPLANSILDQPLAAPNMAAHADPLLSLGRLAPGSAQAAPDTLSELNRPFLPPAMATPMAPVAAPSPAPAAAPTLPPAPAPAASPVLPGAVLSWSDGAAEGRTIIRSGAKIGSPSPAPAASNPAIGNPFAAAAPAPAALLAPVAAPPSMPAAAAAVPASSAAPASASEAALMAALREGLGVSDLQLPALTPEFMKLVGELLHESARGTVDLLVARAALKREVRADTTMIVAKENNPLKFSPTAEVALTHLLGPAVRGFIPPQRAMRDAFDDLRAHQLAFLAGMRAALEGLLQRFDPAALEGRLTQKSMLSSLLPAARKAQLWSVFQQEYQQIAGEVADDFHQVFGREFLRAYEAQLDALKNGQA